MNRVLACHKNGVAFTRDDVDVFSRSWEKSCKSTRLLFELVTKLQPHDTKKTLSLNEARNCIIALSKPMGEAVQLIEMNLKNINEKSSMKGKKQAFIDELTNRIKEYKEEKKFIFDCASRFGVFLKENALIPFNDVFSEYLDKLIRDEEVKESAIRDYRRIVQLRKDKDTYEQKKRIIEVKRTSSRAQGARGSRHSFPSRRSMK